MVSWEKQRELARFIRNNRNLVEAYYACCYSKYQNGRDWKEQLRNLFLGALSSGQQSRIDGIAASIELFEAKVSKMQSPTYEELKRAFGATTYRHLFEEFSSKKYKQMGSKKAALFLRDVLYFGYGLAEKPISEMTELLVPVDRVIIRTMNAIFARDYEPGDFMHINEVAQKTFPDEPMLLEHLWFWGRFYRCKDRIGKGKNPSGVPYCEFNRNLLMIDGNVTRDYRLRLLNFAEQNKTCPIKCICATA